jgi:hypothetical protein
MNEQVKREMGAVIYLSATAPETIESRMEMTLGRHDEPLLCFITTPHSSMLPREKFEMQCATRE